MPRSLRHVEPGGVCRLTHRGHGHKLQLRRGIAQVPFRTRFFDPNLGEARFASEAGFAAFFADYMGVKQRRRRDRTFVVRRAVKV